MNENTHNQKLVVENPPYFMYFEFRIGGCSFVSDLKAFTDNNSINKI